MGQGEQSIVLAAADIATGVELGATLPDDDAAGLDWFAAENLHAQPLSIGIAALGVNCGLDVEIYDIIHIVKEYRGATDLPILVRPNAGTPKRVENQWEYPITAARMAERLPELLEAGVSMVGGCCGTTPDHIAAFRPIIDKWNARK